MGRWTNLGEFYSQSLLPLADLFGGGHPLLLDRRAKLTPITDSFHLPDFYHWLLLPFTEHKVRPQLALDLNLPICSLTCMAVEFLANPHRPAPQNPVLICARFSPAV